MGVDGDDADEFMVIFGEKFKIELSGFVLEKYLGIEAPFKPITFVWRKIFTPEWFFPEKITLADLIRAAKAGRWVKDD